MKILLPEKGEVSIQTVDASRNGFGFISMGKIAEFPLKNKVIIHGPEKNNLYGQIVFHQQLTTNLVRIGIELQETRAKEGYQRMIEGIR